MKTLLLRVLRRGGGVLFGLSRSLHTPVMTKEVIRYLNPSSKGLYVDMTFGGGGHTRAILERVPSANVLCLDCDPTAHALAQNLSEEFSGQVTPLLGKFSELSDLLEEKGIHFGSLDGVLFDFGCSSMQFDEADRGFSLSMDGPLDMRMNKMSEGPTAAEVLQLAEEEDLVKIFKVYGEEKHARKIARAVIEARYLFKPLNTTKQFAELVEEVLETRFRFDKLQRRAHVATKVFQALRIFINDELNEINLGVFTALKYLKIGGRLVTISFHSLEDRIVKNHIFGHSLENILHHRKTKYMLAPDVVEKNNVVHTFGEWVPLSKNVITPSEEEIELNKRSRSAKLRAAVKVK